MRHCPFCSAENADELAVCQACGRRLPPLPPRRSGSKGQPTGIVLPPRATPAAPPPTPRKTGNTSPPPIPGAAPAVAAPAPGAAPAPRPSAELLNALSPSPAAERRDPPPAEARIPGDRRTSAARISQPPPIVVPAAIPPAQPVHDTAPTPLVTMPIAPDRAATGVEPPPTRITRSD